MRKKYRRNKSCERVKHKASLWISASKHFTLLSWKDVMSQLCEKIIIWDDAWSIFMFSSFAFPLELDRWTICPFLNNIDALYITKLGSDKFFLYLLFLCGCYLAWRRYKCIIFKRSSKHRVKKNTSSLYERETNLTHMTLSKTKTRLLY